MTDRVVYELDGEWHMAFISAWRVFERTINPAFSFVLKCNNCGNTGSDGTTFVMSKKNPKAILGYACDCGMTIKFTGTINPDAEDFPAMFLERPKTVLSKGGKKPSGKLKAQAEDYVELMFGDHSE